MYSMREGSASQSSTPISPAFLSLISTATVLLGGYFIQCVHVCMHSCVRLLATPWTVDRQALMCIGLSWQEY